jgi:hypothetical protein
MAYTGQVRPDLLVEDRTVGVERLLGIRNGGKRLILDPDQVQGVLGQVAVARHHDRQGLAHKAGFVDCHTIVLDRYLYPNGKRTGQGLRIGAGDHTHHPGGLLSF